VSQVTDVVDVGAELEVVVINVDDRGKIKLSHKAAKQGGAGPSFAPAGEDDEGGEPMAEGAGGERPDRGARPDRGDRGDRGGRGRGGDRGGGHRSHGGGGGGGGGRRGRGRERTGSRD
jgi:polyribonucleotide nucleotidyltransferase